MSVMPVVDVVSEVVSDLGGTVNFRQGQLDMAGGVAGFTDAVLVPESGRLVFVRVAVEDVSGVAGVMAVPGVVSGAVEDGVFRVVVSRQVDYGGWRGFESREVVLPVFDEVLVLSVVRALVESVL